MIRKYNLKKVISKQDMHVSAFLIKVRLSDGESFLVGWGSLYKNAHRFTLEEVKQYIMLAGLRDYDEYVRTGILSLDMDICPVSQEILDKNRLLYTLKNQLFFQYEEEAIRV